MIRFDHVSKRYPSGHEGLNNVSFHLKDGEMAFLTGHSGAGKSTLLKLIAIIERSTRGNVYVAGKILTNSKRHQIPEIRRNIGIVFQNNSLLTDRSVFHNVALPLVIAGYRHQEIGRRVRASLDKVGLLSRETSLPLTLSTGEQQRVGIARAVVNRPPLLLADEPTGNLDPELSKEVMLLFQQFKQVGVTVLIATHDLSLVSEFGERCLALENGRIISDKNSFKRDRIKSH
ncbi:MAG: cell division ATP-binding protein FtsE [Gammaproteobacteria bacterium]|nr:cell division ATP-binding protein FtsE [Gammaproteobacteria bacterium]